MPIGILPTLARLDLGEGSLTDAVRFRALNAALLEQGAGGFQLSIHREDDLELATADVSFEGANTSFQLHLRVEPARFAAVHNAAQLATAPVLAVAGNSPTFLGHRLWEETRIALFKQAVDHRDEAGRERHDDPRVSFGRGWVRETALELFAESVELHEPLLPVLAGEAPRAALAAGGLPGLAELRLHQGTVWRWNRAVYDPAGGGHLRVELRALPAGPTVVDMAANAALLVGLTLALARDAAWADEHAFEDAHAAFYAAAREGLDAVLPWPGLDDPLPAGELVPLLLPLARAGLIEGAGVAADEADRLLGIVEERVRARQTGARWQRRALAALEGRHGRERALTAMLEAYLAHSEAGEPVHRWPLPSA
ncbi:MAG: glutamate--cysteine ligase [Thermoleophilia bacterium]